MDFGKSAPCYLGPDGKRQTDGPDHIERARKTISPRTVSYTHLDVYKRQGQHAWTLGYEESAAIMRRALDEGITFFDTAMGYQNGTSEEYVCLLYTSRCV